MVEDDGDGRDCYMAFWDVAKCSLGDQSDLMPMEYHGARASSFPGGSPIGDPDARADQVEEGHRSTVAWLGFGW